ncbi:MAG TPA: hypothetical protein VK796_02185, partial [Cytophaga sp.]|nr:hypothetical protein [Cytophaga sp.]
AILLTYESTLTFSAAPINLNIVGFSGFATLFAYNAHTLLALYSKKNNTELTIWAQKNLFWVVVFTLIGLTGSIVAGFIGFAGREWLVLIFSSALWLIYEHYIARLNRSAVTVGQSRSLIKSIVLAMVWTIITSLLPLIVDRPIQSMNINALLFIGIRFCLFACITQLFEYRDIFEKQKSDKDLLSRSSIGFSNLTILCNVFIGAIGIQLIFVEAPVSFICIAIVQLLGLLFFIRIKNIVTITPSMMIWDGILILSPLISIPAYYL